MGTSHKATSASPITARYEPFVNVLAVLTTSSLLTLISLSSTTPFLWKGTGYSGLRNSCFSARLWNDS